MKWKYYFLSIKLYIFFGYIGKRNVIQLYEKLSRSFFEFTKNWNSNSNYKNSLDIIPESHLIVSGSSDGSVKLFTVAGKSIGTFGQPRAWRSINYYLSDSSRGTIPYNLKRASSPSSNMIMRGKKIDHWASLKTIFKTSQISKNDFNQNLWGRWI